MKQLVVALLLFLALPAAARTLTGPEPDSILLVSDIYDLKIVDNNFAVTITRFGVSSFRLDEHTSQFVFCQEISLELESPSLKIFGDIAVVLDSDSKLHFFDCSALPTLTYLGVTDLSLFIADFQIVGSSMYVSSCFNGIRRYSIEDLPDLEFLDASTLGIYVTRLEITGDTLVALDEYNGLMRYDISAEGFGVFIDYLYVPRRVYDIASYESEFYLAVDSGCYVADLSQIPPSITDSLTELDPLIEMYVSEYLLILVYDNDLELRQRAALDNNIVVNAHTNRHQGDFLELNGDVNLVLPEEDGGATMFDLSDDGARSAGLFREGAISGILIYDDKLLTGGFSMPVDAYGISGGAVSYEYTIKEDYFDSVSIMIHNGDTLIALSTRDNIDWVLFYAHSTSPGISIVNAFQASAFATRNLIYLNETVNGECIMLVVESREIEVWAVSDPTTTRRVSTWSFTDGIEAVTTMGSVVYVEGFKYPEIRAYTFDGLFGKVFQEDVGLMSDAHPYKMLIVDDYIYALQWGLIRLIDISDPLNPALGPVVGLPFTIHDACLYGRWLYGVGPEGIVVLDASEQPPVVVDQGGRGGTSLAVGSDILAVNSGDGLHLYKIDTTDVPTWTPIDSVLPGCFTLSQNYPNPFNMTTTISYSLERQAEVNLSVYNSLGQKVVTLVNENQPAGIHYARWDGLTAFGNEAATGVYFYNLTAGPVRESRKMLLIK